MKNTKNLMKLLLLLVITLVNYSCSDETNKLPTDGSVTGVLLRTITNSSTAFNAGAFQTSKADITLEVVAADNGNSLKEVQVYVKYTDSENVFTGAEKFFKTVPQSDFTRDVNSGLLRKQFTYSASDLAAALSITDASIFDADDKFNLRFVAVKNDGKTFTASNNGADLTSSPGFYKSPFLYTFDIVCPISESLSGTHTYVSTNFIKGAGATGVPFAGTKTGSITWADTTTPGLYTTTDLGFGQFDFVWGDTPALSASSRVKWVCSKIQAIGADQYGDTYTYTKVSCVGSVMTIDWVNTYNDAGRVVLTREGGANWPAIFN